MFSLCNTSLFSPAWIVFIHFWKSPGALEIPNGSLLKQCRPDGVTKVVRSRELVNNGICYEKATIGM